ncbi:MAG: hypothetical protein QNJ77_12805 [Acidimicrobiia bacterium]|nr:hypothetical protein [Acidimicrobiia bacterium]
MDELLAHLSRQEREESWHLVTTDGDDLTGGPGLQALLETLQYTRLLGFLLRRLRAAPLLYLLDRMLKRSRGRLGRLVPDVQGPRRYP